MDINRGGDAMLAQRLTHQRADGEVGDIVVVHDIKVHDIRTGGEHVVDFFTEAGKVRRENRRRNQIFIHCRNPSLR